MCDGTIRGTFKDKTYLFYCPICGSSTVVTADSKDEAYERAQTQSVLYRTGD